MSAINMVSDRIDALCYDYLFYVKAMSDGSLDSAEYATCSAQRTLVHDELLELTGLTRDSMPGWAALRLTLRRAKL